MESGPSSDVKIFFKDKQNELKGPYMEREVQEWYREKWFDSSFPFYFMKDDERPTEQTEFLTLDTLCTLNGIGCPFASIKLKSINEKTEEKILELEKELAALSKKCDGVKELEKRMDDVEKRLAELSTQPPPTSNSSDAVVVAAPPLQPVEMTTEPAKKAVAEVKSEVAPVKQSKQTEEEIGNAVAAYVLDAFAVYASGQFGSWKKGRTEIIESSLAVVKCKKVCERILVERMKEKDFFCCELCQEALFNHKQALIHFTGDDHINRETAAVGSSGVAQFRRVLDSFTKLPAELTEADQKVERERFEKYGPISLHHADVVRPADAFVPKLCITYAHLIVTESAIAKAQATGDPRYYESASSILVATEAAVGKVKTAVGRKAFAELHEHLGTSPTYCVFCECNTGDREGFYAHLISSVHMTVFGQYVVRFDILTMLVNVHRKDLI